MGMHARLHDLMVDHGRTLLSQVEGIRNGDADSIHDARVATRRIRAVLSVTSGRSQVPDEAVESQMHRLGRVLGRARDLDVIVDLIEGHGSEAASAAEAALSHDIHLERSDARRQLIKCLEDMPLRALIPGKMGLRRWWPAKGDSGTKLRQRLREQSKTLTDAIAHATGGVYFPNRVHDVRIHAKRLRYLAEIASNVGAWQMQSEIKTLARVQSLLGDVHDREVLMERLERASGDGKGLGSVVAHLGTERDSLFRKYLGLRDTLNETAESIHGASNGRSLNWPLMAASVAVPSALLAGYLAADRRAERRRKAS